MTEIILFLNRGIFQATLFAAERLESIFTPAWALALLSFFSGAVLGLVYRKLVNTDRLRLLKQTAGARIAESILFRREPLVTLRAQAGLLSCALRWLGVVIVPTAVICIPFVFIFSSLNSIFGNASVASSGGLLTLTVAQNENLFQVKAAFSSGLTITSPVRLPSAGIIQHAVKGGADIQAGGHTELHLVTRGAVHDLSSLVSARAPHLQAAQPWPALISGAHVKPPTGMKLIEFSNDPRRYRIFGLELHWLVLSLLFVFAGAISTTVIRGQ